MRKNQNYTGDFKVKVAQAYLFDHLGGYQSVAERFGVTNRSQVQHWVKLYENNPQLLYQDNRGRENTVSRIEQKIYDYGENEIKSKQIGDAVMSELAKSNEVAYIRFASVYKKFANADEFVSALKELRENPENCLSDSLKRKDLKC